MQSTPIVRASPIENLTMMTGSKTPVDPLEGFGFEEAGKLAGLWFGMSYGLATLPVVALDGPLPFFDAAWVASTYRITQKAVYVGGEVGATIDEIIA